MIYVERVTVSPENITLKPGEWYYGASAEVRPSYATCDCVYWRSSDPSVASVNKETGYIYARSAGHAVITAEAADGGGASDCFTVTVTTGEIPVWILTLNYHDIKIKKGATFGLNVSINPWNATNKKLRWSSSNTSVATVNGNGVVTGISAGKATITVEPTDGSECCDVCTVTVEDNAHVTSVTVSPSRLDLAIGEFTYLHAEVCPCDGKDRCVTWSSEDQSIVAVNPDSGFIIARGSGTVKVYATATDGSGARGCCTVTVAAPISVTGIEVSPTSLTLNVCESATLKANVLPCNATNKLVTWSSSDDSVVKVVDIYNGGILAKGVGSATLTATTADGGLKGYCTVTVDPPVAVVGVKIDPSSLTMRVGDSATLNAEVFPCDAANKNVTWRSSNESVVKVVDTGSGKILAAGIGSAIITVTTEDGSFMADCAVEVEKNTRIISGHDVVWSDFSNGIIGVQSYRVDINLFYDILKIENNKQFIGSISAFANYTKYPLAVDLDYPDMSIKNVRIGSKTFEMQKSVEYPLVSPDWVWDSKFGMINSWVDIDTSVLLTVSLTLYATTVPYHEAKLEGKINNDNLTVGG